MLQPYNGAVLRRAEQLIRDSMALDGWRYIMAATQCQEKAVNLVRWLLGRLILFYEFLFSPPTLRHNPTVQATLDAQTRELALYQFQACPFCVKVRFAMKRLGLNIETRDARRVPVYRQELLSGGGKIAAPCLRIASPDGAIQWLYESGDIIRYLEERFSTTSSAG